MKKRNTVGKNKVNALLTLSLSQITTFLEKKNKIEEQ